MTGKILAAGDVHLGSEHADVDAFTEFLDDTRRNRSSVDRLVLLGDVWDLIRRDPFGVAWETSETISVLKDLAAEVPVHFVYGNHDTHLRHLDDSLYDIGFHDELVLTSGETRIHFRHGKDFDGLQFDALSNHLSGPGDRGDIDPTNGLKDPVVATARDAIQTGKKRLRELSRAFQPGAATDEPATSRASYPRRERRAHAYLDSIHADKLVFGHTHCPYVRPDNAVANPGTWKSTAPVHNTYLVIEDGTIELVRHRHAGPDEVVDLTAAPAGRPTPGAVEVSLDRGRDTSLDGGQDTPTRG